ncbi:type VII secretion target [Lentzea sp. HUAS TT2]|uniref:type VII secretion target n=1 Tax=Lentzea sp. HUAS TT2 TaxID=3447454 RepID=UPI003F6F03ED
MSGELDVDGAELRAHANRLSGVESKFDSALRQAREGDLPTEAFGKFATMFPPVVRAVGDVGIQVLVEIEAAVDHIIKNVRDTADVYDGVDEGGASAMKGKGR